MAQTAPSNEATKKLLEQLWTRNLPVLRERLAELQAASAASEASALTAEARQQAASTAHKLAGSLGMFGYPRGTALARELEVLFDGDEAVPGTASSLVRALTEELGYP